MQSIDVVTGVFCSPRPTRCSHNYILILLCHIYLHVKVPERSREGSGKVPAIEQSVAGAGAGLMPSNVRVVPPAPGAFLEPESYRFVPLGAPVDSL